MGEAIVNRRDAIVTLGSEEHVQRLVAASQSESIVSMLSGQVDCLTSGETNVVIDESPHAMWVRNVVNNIGAVSLVVLVSSCSEPVQAVVIDTDHDEWKPRQAVYSYSLDESDDAPGIMPFL